MSVDSLSTWLGFLTSSAAPKGAMSPMELDGYLTGIVLSPDLLLPSRWFNKVWGEDEPTFDDFDQMQIVVAAVMDRHNAIITALDSGFKQIEAREIADYRPLFLAAGKPNHDVVRTWIRGFGKAMALAPRGWCSIVDDERLQPLLAPFVGFMDVRDPDFEPAENIDSLLDEAATAIPRAAIILRKIAQFRTARAARRPSKIGRNDPCPCGSSLKYKRCCAAAQTTAN